MTSFQLNGPINLFLWICAKVVTKLVIVHYPKIFVCQIMKKNFNQSLSKNAAGVTRVKARTPGQSGKCSMGWEGEDEAISVVWVHQNVLESVSRTALRGP